MKSMPVFFVDNHGLLTPDAELVGNLVVAKVDPPQKFPVAAMIGQASVAGFDGLLVIQGGNAAIVVNVFSGKTKDDLPEIRKIMTTLKPSQWPGWIHQYRIDVMGLIQFMALFHAGDAGSDDCSPYSLLDLLAAKGGQESTIIQAALKAFLSNPKAKKIDPTEAFNITERLLLSWD